MPTTPTDPNPVIRKILLEIGSNPGLLDELIKANNDRERKAILVTHGLIEPHTHGPSQDDVLAEIALMTEPVQPDYHGDVKPERAVEWVGAIAGAAGGAAAAFCWAG